MSVYEASITNPKKQLEFYKQLSEQLQQENKILKENGEHNDKVVDKVNWKNMLLKKENKQLEENYERIYNENCILRENHNINDISLLDENYKIKNNLNKLKEWLEEIINEIKTNDIYDRTEYECTQITTLESVLAKLQEIEGGINERRNK